MSLLIRIVLDKSPVCETLIFVHGKHLGLVWHKMSKKTSENQ